MKLGPLDLRDNEIQGLNALDSVDLLRDLLWAEATRVGLNRSLIDVPGAITISDGGIDGQVINSLQDKTDCFIPKGLVCFQVKSGDFPLTQAANARDILCKPKQPAKPWELNDRVRGCLEKGGTLIIVTPGWDNPESKNEQLSDLFQTELNKVDGRFPQAKFAFWRTNVLKTLIKSFPAIAINLKGGSISPFQTFRSWQSNQAMQPTWIPGAGQEAFVEEIRKSIRTEQKDDLRVIAEPGLGKTRAVLESLRPTDLAPLVLYAPGPSDILASPIVNEIRLSSGHMRVILVVDECDFGDKAHLVDNLASLAPSLTLVTIHNEFSPGEGKRPYLTPQPLEDQEIGRILESYKLPPTEIPRWIPWCSGSPRVAHVLGENLRTNHEDIFMSPSHVDVWNRFIAGRERQDSDKTTERRRVLMLLSLFKKFGFETPYDDEREAISRIAQVDYGICAIAFNEIIQWLRRRRILQGTKTLYITPKLFHIWLWEQWWDAHGNGFDLAKSGMFSLSDGTKLVLPDHLMNWHLEMYNYATSAKANVVVEEILEADSLFTLDSLDTGQGSSFFLQLTEANPKAALRRLEKALSTATNEDLLGFRIGRHNIVVALQMICVWKDLFIDGAMALLKLAEAETENYSNNATGVFIELFSLAPGEVAPTEAQPEIRFALLRMMLKSNRNTVRSLAYKGISQALFHGQFIRMSGFETQGTRTRPDLWKPTSMDDWQSAYLMALNLCEEALDSAQPEERPTIGKILLERIRGLSRSVELSKKLVEIFRKALELNAIEKRDAMASVSQMLSYWSDGQAEEARRLWESFSSELISDSFHDRLLRFAGLQLITDRFNKAREHEDQTVAPLSQLADEAIQNPELLTPELPWLMSSQAQNGLLFGAKLGEKDQGFELLPLLLEAQISTGPLSTYFLAGYLREYQKSDPEGWETVLDRLADVPAMSIALPQLTWQSGDLTSRSAHRILALAKEKAFPPGQFHIFAFGMATKTLSDSDFASWIKWLAENDDREAVLVGLELTDIYMENVDRAPLPKEVIGRLLTNPVLTTGSDALGTMADHYWSEVATSFLEDNPDQLTHVVDFLLGNIGNEGGIGAGFFPTVLEVVTKLIPRHPTEVWQAIEKHLGPPIGRAQMTLRSWLRSLDIVNDKGEGALELFPEELIWSWVNQDIDNRAWYLAHLVPKRLFREDGKTCLAREVLVRFGDREDVQNELAANYHSGMWTGPMSNHYRSEALELEKFREGETNINVLQWLNKMIEGFFKEADRESDREEREDF